MSEPVVVLEVFLRLPVIPQPRIDETLEAGVSYIALSHDPGEIGFTLAGSDVVFDAAGRFEFAADAHNYDAVSAVLVLARDRYGEPVDIVAAAGDRLASWLGRASMLGEQNLLSPRIASDALPLHSDLLDWLRDERRGILILDPLRARWELAGEGPFLASSRRTARALTASLTLPAPRIAVAPSMERRVA